VALACSSGSAGAHTGGSTGYASILVQRNVIRYSLSLTPSSLPPAVAEELAQARAGHAGSRERLLGHVRRKVALTAQGTRCESAQGFLEPGRNDVETVTLVVDFACAGPVRDLGVRDDLFDVLGPDHHTLARVEAESSTQQFAFATEAREARFALSGPGERSAWSPSFFRLGMRHILGGYDHLLFLLALLLRGGRLLSLLKIVTAFTLAHSLTLALAVLDVVVLPERLVEGAIALSIALVAAENLRPCPATSRRWLLSLGFGFVHGFGFSSALRELGLPRHGLAASLLGFNLGVEAGQALVVAVTLPLLLWMRARPWEPRAVRLASVALAAVGLGWFVERVFLA
jgi:hypothetical protein